METIVCCLSEYIQIEVGIRCFFKYIKQALSITWRQKSHILGQVLSSFKYVTYDTCIE